MLVHFFANIIKSHVTLLGSINEVFLVAVHLLISVCYSCSY